MLKRFIVWCRSECKYSDRLLTGICNGLYISGHIGMCVWYSPTVPRFAATSDGNTGTIFSLIRLSIGHYIFTQKGMQAVCTRVCKIVSLCGDIFVGWMLSRGIFLRQSQPWLLGPALAASAAERKRSYSLYTCRGEGYRDIPYLDFSQPGQHSGGSGHRSSNGRRQC